MEPKLSSSKLRRVGILGGMGPQATVLLQQRLIDIVDAADDAQHIPLLIDMNSQISSRLDYVLSGRGEDPGRVLGQMARRLEVAGAEALAMPCNTAHYFVDQVTASVQIPFLNMIDLVGEAISLQCSIGGKVGVLASPAAEKIGVFDKAFRPYGLRAIYPDNRASMVDAIRAVKSVGPSSSHARAALANAATECVRKGARHLLIGCTEFSTIADAADGFVPVVDALQVLVERICDFSGASRKPVSGAAGR
ncbi:MULTISPECIES: aspartate/glutamate racemase family protein [Neorhizobium]|uniref:aspartate/glutamate racemase family protein n=1 Tax=Neorhizobium TaxID=1525371 RepID=UPI000CF9FE66|nr:MULTISPECIES: amino acid racemase [Neorhizobium]